LGNTAEVAALKRQAGLLESFLLVGPFENTGGGGLGVRFGPEDEPSPSKHFDGFGRAVGWRAVDGAGPLGVLAVHDHVWPNDETVAYAMVYLHSDAEQDVALRIGASDQLQVQVGGATLLETDGRHAFAPDQFVVPVRLQAGWTRLLFKLGQISGGWQFMVRLTAPNGGPLAGWRASTDVSLHAQATGAGTRASAYDPLMDAADRAAKGCAPAGNGTCAPAPKALLLEEMARLRRVLNVDDVRQRPGQGVMALRAARELAPKDAMLITALADALAGDDVNHARELYQEALRIDAAFAPAWLGMGRMRRYQELHGEAQRALERAHRADPRWARVAAELQELRAQRSVDPDAAVQDLAVFAERKPAVAALEALMRMETTRGRLQRALDLALRIRKLAPGHRAGRVVVLEAAERRADREVLLQERMAALAADPHSVSAVKSLAAALRSQGRTAEALQELERFCSTHPDATEAWEAVGALHQELGQLDKALKAYRTVLSVHPQNAYLRRHVERLESGQPFDERYVLDVPALLAEPIPPQAREMGGYVLGHVVAHRLYDNGLSAQVVDQAWRLLDAAKGPLIQRVRVAYTPGREMLEVLQAERVTPSGEVFAATRAEQDSNGHQGGVYTDQRVMTVDFGTVGAGDVVRLRYRRDATGERNLFGDFFGTMEYAQGYLPKRKFELVVEAPAHRPLYHRSVRLPAVVHEARGTHLLYRVSASNLPPVVPEAMMPAYSEVGAYVMFSSYSTWDALGRWYANLVREQLMLNDALKRLVRELMVGASDDDDRIRRIHAYVVRHTRYVGIELGIHGWKPYRVSQVHARGYGDCKDKASLLVALLKEAGIDANLVLLRTYQEGVLADLPSMWSFNHAIAYVPSRGLFLDGTAEFSGVGELPAMDQDTLALAVDVETGVAARVTPPASGAAANANMSDYRVLLGADGSATLEGEERFTGQLAPEMRMTLQDPATQERVLETHLASLYPGADVTKVVTSGAYRMDAPMTYTFSARIPAFGQVSPDGLLLPITLYPHGLEREYTPLTNRVHDLVLPYPSVIRNRMRFVIPHGYTLTGLPQSSALRHAHFEFSQTVTATADGYVVEEATLLKSRRIPAGAYPSLRAALVEADRRMRLKVRLVPQETGGSAVRAAREWP
jgi:tetratricopeptide (TPR) repeat protein